MTYVPARRGPAAMTDDPSAQGLWSFTRLRRTPVSRVFSKPSSDLRRNPTQDSDTQAMSTHQEIRPSDLHQRVGTVAIVDSVGCHFCADAEAAITELTTEYAIDVTHIPMSSPQGMDLMQSHGAGMSPLVLLDGQFVSSGRLPRGRIRTMLDAGGYRRAVSAP